MTLINCSFSLASPSNHFGFGWFPLLQIGPNRSEPNVVIRARQKPQLDYCCQLLAILSLRDRLGNGPNKACVLEGFLFSNVVLHCRSWLICIFICNFISIPKWERVRAPATFIPCPGAQKPDKCLIIPGAHTHTFCACHEELGVSQWCQNQLKW